MHELRRRSQRSMVVTMLSNSSTPSSGHLSANFGHLCRMSGVVAATLFTHESPQTYGEPKYLGITRGLKDALLEAGERGSRTVMGDHSFFVEKVGEDVVVVVLPKGHATAKSINRTIRRLSERRREAA